MTCVASSNPSVVFSHARMVPAAWMSKSICPLCSARALDAKDLTLEKDSRSSSCLVATPLTDPSGMPSMTMGSRRESRRASSSSSEDVPKLESASSGRGGLGVRHPATTFAPRDAKPRVISSPIPPHPPVTTALTPARSSPWPMGTSGGMSGRVAHSIPDASTPNML